ncbi:response regulator [Hirschia litorea]|uniref:Response regulator n=1 Tax=Hirschia litorea TaxID=1199156 RepID=A0ABW2IKP5_9PROT
MANKLANISILVLDDHRNMRLLWRGILLAFGIRTVNEADNAEDAFKQVGDKDIDAIIVDQHLDGLTGAEFVGMLRRAPDSPSQHVPVIACTADTRRSTLKLLVDAGVDEILAKPVSADQAWKKLAAVVNNRRQFVKTAFYYGPDRRRKEGGRWTGKERRREAPVPRDEDEGGEMLG